MSLITFTPKGFYCEKADVYIDPTRKVNKAIVTHAHSDHARSGHKWYLCSERCKGPLTHRLGNIHVETLPFGQSIFMNGVKISLHPAGHIIGSSQVRLEYKGEIWVISGDYKTEHDGFSIGYEPVKCTHFVSECTFGLPIYKWRTQEEVFHDINSWWSMNASFNRTSVLQAYSLGKAQRLLQSVDHSIGPVYVHPGIAAHNRSIEAHGINLKPYEDLEKVVRPEVHALIISPSSTTGPWFAQFEQLSEASASGWMALRSNRRNRLIDRGFTLSDHADWGQLTEAIKLTEAENIYVTHGYTQAFSRWLKDLGLNAEAIYTQH